jgi:hypothetical protein
MGLSFQVSSGPGSSKAGLAGANREKEKKIGHRRVDDTGQVTYKKVDTQSSVINALGLRIVVKVEHYSVMKTFILTYTLFSHCLAFGFQRPSFLHGS